MWRNRSYLLRVFLNVLLVGVFVGWGLGYYYVDLLQKLEAYTYDLRLNMTMPGGVDKRVVILDIDEKSLRDEGHWPWPRDRIAKMIELLFDKHEIDVLGFDMVFAEADRSSGLQQLQALANNQLYHVPQFRRQVQMLQPLLDYNRRFAMSLRDKRVVLGYYFDHDPERTAPGVGALPQPILTREEIEGFKLGAADATGYTGNLANLQEHAMGAGYYNASPLVDKDGVFRRFSLVQMYQGQLYEGLSLAMARLAFREPGIRLIYDGDPSDPLALEAVEFAGRTIPVDAEVGALVPYRGKQGSFPYLSATDLLNDRVPEGLLQDAIVLVGATAPGLMDLRNTPVQDIYPGVEVHANLIAGMLDGNVKQQPPYSEGLEFIALVLVGLVLMIVLPRCNPLQALMLFVGMLVVIILINLYAWQRNLVLPLASLLILATILFVLNMSYGFFVESRGKRLITRVFGQYVPPELVAEMAVNPAAFSLEGENRELTVLFSDVRDFTSISEGLDPKELTQLMNEYLTPMTHIIHRHRGTIDKYIGDAVMAFWGAPVPEKEHPRLALLAALDMLTSVEELRKEFAARGWPQITIGIGLNTGNMTVGNMGSEFRKSYTVMGDAVNLGSRLEGLTKNYGAYLIVSDSTRQAVEDIAYRELDLVRVKGKREPVAIYEPLGVENELSDEQRDCLSCYHQALSDYRQQRWQQAQQGFEHLLEKDGDSKLYRLYLERCQQFIERPPPRDWDGVFTFTTK